MLDLIISIFRRKLKLEHESVKFVQHDDKWNLLSDSLRDKPLHVESHAFDTVNDDDGTIAHPEACCDLIREARMPRRVHKVEHVAFLPRVLHQDSQWGTLQADLPADFIPPIVSPLVFAIQVPNVASLWRFVRLLHYHVAK